MTTMTDTRAALDAAIRDLTDQIGCAPHHRDTLVATLDNRIAAHVTAEVARQTVTIRRDLDEARELRHVVCDRCGEPIQWAAPGRTACPCSVAVAAAPEVEAAIDVLINAEDIDTRECVDAERGYIRSEDSRTEATEAAALAARTALRAAIAADKGRLDAEWQTHDRERDAEVARAQADVHELVGTIHAICRAVGVADVPTGEGWGDRVVAAVAERVAADKTRVMAAPEVEVAIDDLIRIVSSAATHAEHRGVCGIDHDDDADQRRENEYRAFLRAAIAADKARAVAAARRAGFASGSAERSSVHDAIGVSSQEAARAAMAHGAPCPTCGTSAE